MLAGGGRRLCDESVQLTMPRILIVDDEPSIIQLLCLRLKAHGYAVDFAYDGPAGLECAQANPPDLIVLDVYMPLVNGIETLELLKADERTRHLPVVMLTGVEQPEIMRRLRELGADLILIKPIDTDQLVQELDRLLPADSS